MTNQTNNQSNNQSSLKYRFRMKPQFCACAPVEPSPLLGEAVRQEERISNREILEQLKAQLRLQRMSQEKENIRTDWIEKSITHFSLAYEALDNLKQNSY